MEDMEKNTTDIDADQHLKHPGKGRAPRSLFQTGASGAVVEEQEKRESILYAAATLFADKGYAGTAVREIVEAAGITKPTLYYYFKNKEDLYIKLMDAAVEVFFQTLDRSLAVEGSMRKRLVSLFTDIYQLFESHLEMLRLVNSMVYGPSGATPAYDITVTHAHLEKVLSQILGAGVAEGELSEDNWGEVMFLLMGVMRSIQCHLVMKNLPLAFTSDRIVRIIDLIFDGARASRK